MGLNHTRAKKNLIIVIFVRAVSEDTGVDTREGRRWALVKAVRVCKRRPLLACRVCASVCHGCIPWRAMRRGAHVLMVRRGAEQTGGAAIRVPRTSAGRQGGREAGSVLLWFSSTNYYIERLGREAGSVLLSHRVMEGF